MVWIYETFPNIGRQNGKSKEVSLILPRFLRWHTRNIATFAEEDPFRHLEQSSKIVHPYLTPTLREMEQSYMQTLVLYKNEVKDVAMDALKAELSGITVLESYVASDDKDVDLGCGQSRLAQETGEGERYSVELVDRLSRIEDSLSSLKKCVSSMEQKLRVVMDYVTEEKRRME